MTTPASRAAGLAAIVTAIAASGVLVPRHAAADRSATTAAKVASAPRCFGAAARDPRHPCNNRRLRFMVRPRPSIAQITPNAPCERVKRYGPVHPCAFGARRAKAVDTIALTGDSHASHWRAAVEVAADAKRWRGLSITNGICPVSKTPWLLPEPERSQCSRWNRAVLGWLSRRPEITTVFQSQIVSHRNVSARPGEDQFAAKVRGYIEEWKAFPRSVKHIIVIRDDPRTSYTTARCVMRARADRRRPGIACSATRAWALQPDPLAVAARQTRSRRVQLIDLTRFMCNERRCFAVVGGALVHKDQNHLTRVFATSLGPYLLRRLNRLSAKWRRPR